MTFLYLQLIIKIIYFSIRNQPVFELINNLNSGLLFFIVYQSVVGQTTKLEFLALLFLMSTR